MEKVLTFSQEQKSLIWQRFVQPSGGTEKEAKHFVEVCETFGLNPLLGDIVFQKYETRQGSRTNFITTRDGLLRVASQQKDYVGAPVSNVVREGDEFEFLPSEGNVRHKFGEKRGSILGAYAILKHRRFHPISVFVDFEEYFKANARSQNGKSPIWDAMPSAMIQKVAEVFVLRRQFPLGGLYTQEEMGLEAIEETSGDNREQVELSSPTASSTERIETKRKAPEEREQQENEEMRSEKLKPSEEKPSAAPTSDETPSDGQYVMKQYESGKSPSGVPFAKVTVKDQQNGETLLVLAKDDEGVALSKTIPKDKPFDMEIRKENGFFFLQSVNGQKATREQAAS